MPAAVDVVPLTREGAVAAQAVLNKSRIVSQLPAMIKELSDREQVAILNVGPWSQIIKAGTLGTKYVPACRDDEEYSDPLVLDGVIAETYPLREGALDILMDANTTGWQTAQELLGFGRGLHPQNRKDKYGLFATKGNPNVKPLKEDATAEEKRLWLRERFRPTKTELEKARRALNGYYNALVAEAKSAFAQGQKAAEETIRPERHILAAVKLRLDPKVERWMQNALPEPEREGCPYCGASVPQGLPVCQNCHKTIDPGKLAEVEAAIAAKAKK